MGDNKDLFVPPADPKNPLFTKEFLQNALFNGQSVQVVDFQVENGTELGDNYMSVLYSVSARLKREKEPEWTAHFMFKCFPTHPSRQQLLINTNLFYKELSFYQDLLPELTRFQEEVRRRHFPTQFVDDHGGVRTGILTGVVGKTINFEMCAPGEKAGVCNPLENYIVMSDIRKEWGYKMANRRKGLDERHMKLAFIELANLHSLSWAYRKKVEWDLTTKFPFLKRSDNPKKTEMWLNILEENVNTAVAAINSSLGSGGAGLSTAMQEFVCKAKPIIEHFSVQDEAKERTLWNLMRDQTNQLLNVDNEEPWRVVCHGDCWSNNMLFKYDPVTSLPDGVTLVDFPLARLGCPSLDLACLVYTSTRRHFRKSHLDSCLQEYVTRFTEVCSSLNCEPLPGFSLSMLQRKLHLSKLVGFLIAVISLPLNLLEGGKEVDMEEQRYYDATMESLLQKACASGGEGSLYQEWMVELATDLYDDGVI